MRFLIPFNLLAQNKSVNKHLLHEYGLEKNSFLNVHFNDTVGKNELVNDLLLSTILPKEWSLQSLNQDSKSDEQIPDPVEIPNG